MRVNSILLLGICMVLTGCNLNPDKQAGAAEAAPVVEKPVNWLKAALKNSQSYEVKGVHPKVADAISRDMVALLVANIPPAKNRLIFQPPAGAVTGLMMQQRLREAGYGLQAAGTPGGEVVYYLDLLSNNPGAATQILRFGLRFNQWRLERLYQMRGGQLYPVGTTSNLPLVAQGGR